MAMLKEIQGKVLRRQYELSRHAVDQSIVREIAVAELDEAISNRVHAMKETLIETEVTYTLELGGKFYLVEHVPARVCPQTG